MNKFRLNLLHFFTAVFVLYVPVTASAKQEKDSSEKMKSYSFRPLLIQGKKRLTQKTKDLKLETDNILDTQIFFEEIDFKKRIFSDEGLE